ncbi:MAG TPA: hypothetical protein VGD98_24600 [Ktedonobacteraceae bacterium]
MNLSAAIPPTQMILSWALLIVLCVWMIFCAFLALRPHKAGKREAADVLTPSGAIPVIASSVSLRRATMPVDVSFSSVPALQAESVNDVGSPVA